MKMLSPRSLTLLTPPPLYYSSHPPPRSLTFLTLCSRLINFVIFSGQKSLLHSINWTLFRPLFSFTHLFDFPYLFVFKCYTFFIHSFSCFFIFFLFYFYLWYFSFSSIAFFPTILSFNSYCTLSWILWVHFHSFSGIALLYVPSKEGKISLKFTPPLPPIYYVQ